MVRPEASSCGCQTNTPDRIHVLASMRIVDPCNTPINREPGDKEIKVLLVPDNGNQSLVIVSLMRDEFHYTVQDLVVMLKEQFHGLEIHGVYLVSDPVNNVRYVVMARTKSGCDTSENSEVPSSSTSSTSAKFTPTKSTRKRWIAPSHFYKKKSKDIIEILCHNTDERLTLDLRKNAEVIATYPEQSNGITITIKDFKCLNRKTNLNDVIIDFYLKYLLLERLPKPNQERTYVFSSFFYTKLSNPRLSLADATTSHAMLQHAEVKRWTKNVNIFEKDFLIIPINQQDHWFLCVICYPGLITTQRDIANKWTTPDEQQCPWIVIFDSLPSVDISKPKVVGNLKSYLECEFTEKYGESDLVLNDLQVIYADVPQQLNSSDCGLYLLQFAEEFFKDFIYTHTLQLLKKPLNNWFKLQIIKEKRDKIRKLIMRLAVLNQKNQNK